MKNLGNKPKTLLFDLHFTYERGTIGSEYGK